MKLTSLQNVVILVVTTSQLSLAGDFRPICSICACLPTSTEVDCRNRDLREIPDFRNDTVSYAWGLDLSSNRIRNITKFPPLPNLLELHIRENFPARFENAAFENLENLKTLNLRKNGLTHDQISEEVFQGKYNLNNTYNLGLEVLDLSYNNFSILPRHCLRHLSALKKLILAHNPFGDLSMSTSKAINELHHLVELDLSQTGLDRLPDHFLSDLVELQVLILAGNKFKSVPAEINYGRNLIHLNLNANPIQFVEADDFREGTAGLRKLEMSAMPELKGVGRQAFSNLKSLEFLQLSNCPNLVVIDNEAFYQVDAKDTLKEIHLQGNHLTTLHENMLPWMDIQFVDLQDNPWTCDCNLRWVAEKLLNHLEDNPMTTLSLLCTEPASHQGETLAKVLEDPHGFECPNTPSFTKRAMYGPIIISTIAVGILLLVTGSVLFAYALYRRTRLGGRFGESVKYRRANDDDEESFPNTIHT